MIVHICTFDSVLDMFTRRGRKGYVAPTYDEIKSAVLKAGRYSSFEAGYSKRTARFFTSLESDPDVICTRDAFPWIRVEKKA